MVKKENGIKEQVKNILGRNEEKHGRNIGENHFSAPIFLPESSALGIGREGWQKYGGQKYRGESFFCPHFPARILRFGYRERRMAEIWWAEI